MNQEGLIGVLIDNESITHVYFDKNGGWLFVPNVLHPVVKTREEVLDEWTNSKQDPPAEIEEADGENSKQDPPAEIAGKVVKKK